MLHVLAFYLRYSHIDDYRPWFFAIRKLEDFDTYLRYARRLRRKYGLLDLAIEHKIGRSAPGEIVFQVVCAGEHRTETIMAMEEAIERVKIEAPIWKKEVSGDREWWIKDRQPARIDVVVDGKKIPLNPFISEFISKTILAMLSMLRGVNVRGDERLVLKVFTYSPANYRGRGEEEVGKNKVDREDNG